MSLSRKRGEYPNLVIGDVVDGGTLTLWRNPVGVQFGEKDAWELSADWATPSGIHSAYSKLRNDESELAKSHAFAWDSEFGYLSPFPRHCGTAMRVEGTFHLEALHLIGDLPQALNAIPAVRFESSSVVEDGIRQAAHLFRVRNAAVLGISEHELLNRAKNLFTDLAMQEVNARRALVEEMPRVIEDAVARSIAVLRHARLLSPGEILDLLSPISLAASMGFLKGITVGETRRLMRDQLNAPSLPESRTAEDDRRRDARDARLADRFNKRFETVSLNSYAEECLL
jgi:protein arginine kinase